MTVDLSKVNVYVRPGPTDMRKQINGLAVLVEESMGGEPMSGNLYLFCNRRRTHLKILYWDANGFALWLNVVLMRYLRTSSVGTEVSDRVLVGRPARVVLPVGPDRRGRVSLEVQGQVIYLVARPYRAGRFDVGDQVVVVEVDRGAALVTSLEELNR